MKSRLARQFCLLFMLCAFAPAVALILISYNQVVKQFEEQSLLRLKREVQSYSVSLFDRIVRIDNELQSIGRLVSASRDDILPVYDQDRVVFEELFRGIGIFSPGTPVRHVFGALDVALVKSMITDDTIAGSKPFILTTSSKDHDPGRFFFGANMHREGMDVFTVVAEVKPEYLWGIGPNLLLPPVTELSVYDRKGNNIIASQNGPGGIFSDLKMKQNPEDLRVFEFQHNGESYHAGFSNLFVESRFQDVGWIIIISRAKREIMSAMDNFKRTFPFIVLFFLLVIAFLSVLFIRRGLEPLEHLKQGTQRFAEKDFTELVDIRSGDEFEELGKSFNQMAVKLDKQFNALTLLGEIDRSILSSLDRKIVVATTLQRLRQFFRCETAVYVKITNPSADLIKVYSMKGRRLSDPVYEYFPLSREMRDTFFIPQEFLIVKPEEPGHEFLRTITAELNLVYLCLPLSMENRINRVLILGQHAEYVYTEDELSQARQIANQLAVGVANSLTVEKLDKLAKGTIEALARTVDAKSKWTSGHSERVAALSGEIGRIMGLTEQEVVLLERGGLLHDIGKIGIPQAILDKPGRLTEKEYTEIKNHPQIGAKILEPIEVYQDIIPLILQHHEKYDGTGYPAGLKGEEIFLGARIMSVADVWDALVSERPYRQGWVLEKARTLIIEGKGSSFDPDVVNAFLTATSER